MSYNNVPSRLKVIYKKSKLLNSFYYNSITKPTFVSQVALSY